MKKKSYLDVRNGTGKVRSILNRATLPKPEPKAASPFFEELRKLRQRPISRLEQLSKHFTYARNLMVDAIEKMHDAGIHLDDCEEILLDLSDAEWDEMRRSLKEARLNKGHTD